MEESILRLAVIQKAVRLLALVETPYGTVGEMTEYGVRTMRPDFAIRELLFGLRGLGFDTNDVEVSVDDVLAVGFDNPAVVPELKEDIIEEAILGAKFWCNQMLKGYSVV